jgi:hypothetical protein
MVASLLSDSNVQSGAMVHLPRSTQRREISPVRVVVARRVERVSRILPLGGRSVGQYAGSRVSGIPAIVLDITR